MKLNELKECLDESVRSQDFAKAAEIKHNISELETERNQLLDLPQTQTEEIRTEKVGKGKCIVIFLAFIFKVGVSSKYKCKWKLVFPLEFISFSAHCTVHLNVHANDTCM